MAINWQLLVGNLALAALFISVWIHAQILLGSLSLRLRRVLFGVTMGVAAVASMLTSLQLQTGNYYDLRTALIAIASFFGGPIAGGIAVAIAVAYRLGLGGTGAVWGIGMIILTGCIGYAVSVACRGRLRGIWSVALLGVLIGGLNFGVLQIAANTQRDVTGPMVGALAAMSCLAVLIMGYFLLLHTIAERDRQLMLSAFNQSPDYLYVKGPDSRLVAANVKVAQHHGFASPVAMRGLTDVDLSGPERGKSLLDGEQELMRTDTKLHEQEEVIVDLMGDETWFSTSKIPLHNLDGQVIGLAGLTRDVTRSRRLERDVTRSRNQLDFVLSGVSDGIAMFDSQGTLVYRNKQYSDLFPLTVEIRRPGQHIRDILEEVLRTKEQVVPPGQEQKWLETIVASLKSVSEEEIQLYDGRWLHLKTRPTADGSALVVVSDVTKNKQVETALLTMTEQLKLLATTDGLTGLTNRRAFDAALESEIARSRRNSHPMSLLMVDVDRFKAYNDLYGHQAGDDVLRKVAQSLRDVVRRPGDVAARYGGEEFVAILPNTDEDGAFFIADAFREGLRGLGIEHKGSDKGVLTASVGLATFTDRDAGTNATELVRRADEALYNAKAAGRDRVTGWRPKYAVRPVGGMRA